MAKKKDILERTKDLLNDEERTMDTICSHISSGGSLIDLCETWDVRFGDITTWIRKEKSRRTRYDGALNDRTEWVRESVLLELKRIGTSDIRKLYDEDGNIKPVHEWPSDVAHFVSSIEQVEEFEGSGRDREQVGWVKKVKLWNKEKGLELLGKNLSMFVDRLDHSGTITLEDLVNQSREDDGEQGDKS